MAKPQHLNPKIGSHRKPNGAAARVPTKGAQQPQPQEEPQPLAPQLAAPPGYKPDEDEPTPEPPKNDQTPLYAMLIVGLVGVVVFFALKGC